MLFKFFITALLWFNCSLADGADLDKTLEKEKNRVVFDAINVIAEETRKLDVILQQWDGSITEALPINSQTNAILSAIKKGMKDTEDSKKLGIGGALKVRRATLNLIKDTRNVTMDLVYMKDRFRAITLAGTVKANLKKIQEASNEFNKVVVKKLPRIGRPIGRHLGRRVNKLFTKAIEEYESKEPAPIQPPPKKTRTRKPKPAPTRQSISRQTAMPKAPYRKKEVID